MNSLSHLLFESNLLLLVGCVAAISAVYVIYQLWNVGKRPIDLPPGPPTLPLIGNLHLMPTSKAHVQFAKWAQEYGSIYSLMLGTSTFVVLNSPEVVKELIDRRGGNYSSRTDLYVGAHLASSDLRFVAMKYGPSLRLIRKLIHNILNQKASIAFSPYQALESRLLMVDLLNDPAEYMRHLRRFSNSSTVQIIYGFRTPSWKDEKLQAWETIFSDWVNMAASIPAQLFDCYPILRRLPEWLMPVCRTARNLDKRGDDLYRQLWAEEKARIENKTAMPSFCGSLYKAQKIEGFDDRFAARMAGTLIEASSNTTAEQLQGLVLALVCFPKAQRKAQEELDAVVGPNRLPTIDDMPNLPYVRNCVKEAMRWCPNVTLLIPHSNLKDDIYQGYTIPKGSAVIVNNWALNMDERRWPNPRIFDPDRFRNDTRSEIEVATSSDFSSRHNYIFGGGRRICQGIHIAERSMFLVAACMMWGFDLSTPDISKIDTEDLRGGFAVVPAPFEANIKCRSEERAQVIREEWRHMEDEWLDPNTKQWKKVPDGIPLNTYTEEKIES